MIKYAYFFLSHPKAKTVKFVPLCYSKTRMVFLEAMKIVFYSSRESRKTGMVFLEAMNIVFILAIESRKVHRKPLRDIIWERLERPAPQGSISDKYI